MNENEANMWRVGNPSARACVLVVDDDPEIRRTLGLILEDDGYSVIAASAGSPALDLYSRFHPDAVLLDVEMPGVNGVETLRWLRQMDPDAHVAMLTGSCRRQDINASIEAGARDFVLKPFDIDQVLNTVARLLPAASHGRVSEAA